MQKIELLAKPRAIKLYRSLLRSGGEGHISRRALDLVRIVLADSGLRFSLPWEASKNDYPITYEASDYLRSLFFTVQFDKTRDDFPVLPTRRAEKATEYAQLTLASAVFLNLQIVIRDLQEIVLYDSHDFLRNCQSLLYVNLVSEILPELRSARLRREEDFLIDSLRTHSILVWKDTPSHSAYLAGTLASYLNDSEIAQNAFEFSFSTTDVEDHEYLTKAHRLWYSYLDSGQSEKAKDFLFNLLRTVPPEDADEVKEMLDDTYTTLARGHGT